MKGLKIIRAEPSNAIDIYALLSKALKEKVYPGTQPSARQLQNFYLNVLLQQHLVSPFHYYFLARRGRGYLGFIHGMLIPSYWDGSVESMFIELLFVAEKHRKKGVARKLLETLNKQTENIGVKKVDLCAVDSNLKFWGKHGAIKVTNTMRIEL